MLIHRTLVPAYLVALALSLLLPDYAVAASTPLGGSALPSASNASLEIAPKSGESAQTRIIGGHTAYLQGAYPSGVSGAARLSTQGPIDRPASIHSETPVSPALHCCETNLLDGLLGVVPVHVRAVARIICVGLIGFCVIARRRQLD